MAKNPVIRDTDKGFKKLMRDTASIQHRIVTVGIHKEEGGEPKKSPPGAEQKSSKHATLVEVASAHEFGGPNNRPPKRSFIGDWFDESRGKNSKLVTDVSKQVMLGKMGDKRALELLGVKFQGDIRARISKGIAPPLADSTLGRRKDSTRSKKLKGKERIEFKRANTTPLINTGQLRASISYKVDYDPGAGA